MSRIVLSGDYYVGEDYDKDEFLVINEYLQGSQTNVINFEGSLHSDHVTAKAVSLPMGSDSLLLPDSTILSLSNNHVLDFGTMGLQRTISELDKNKISWFGLESKLHKGDNYKIIKCGDVNVCFVGFGWRNEECIPAGAVNFGVPDYSQKNIDRTFDRLKGEKYDYLIMYYHGGYEYEYYPLPLHVGLSRYLIEKGADFVYGSHSHCIQPYEIYKEKYIFYGLGNFYFSSGRERYPDISDRGLNVVLSVSKSQLVLERLDRVQYDRYSSGVRIADDEDFLESNKLEIRSLEVYSKEYVRLRTRKKNPRPIMYHHALVSNEVKYWAWLIIVKVTGFLKIRQIVKKLLGWA